VNHRGHLDTERRNPRSQTLDRLDIPAAFDLINREDATIAVAVAAAKHDICRAIECVENAFRTGGRLIYVGAGTSGRLGVLDATECPPTFLSRPQDVQGVIAGGREALTRSIEGAEDDTAAASAAIDQLTITQRDVVFGIATGGTTPFVHAALARAQQLGAITIFLACVPKEQVADKADVSIRVLTGPEVLTGSTRMKAGTATKMVLNMITTIAWVRVGKVYENLMVDVNTSANAKLVDRGTRIIQEVTGLPPAESAAALQSAGGRVKVALAMVLRGVNRTEAERLLNLAEGRLSLLIQHPPADRVESAHPAGR